MLGDSQLAEYLDGGLEAQALQKFEELAAENESAIEELVAQQRIHQALQVLMSGAKADRNLKQAIMEATCGKETGNGASNRRNRPEHSDPGFVIALVGFVLVALLSAGLWHFASNL